MRSRHTLICIGALSVLTACEAIMPMVGGLISAAAANWNRGGLDYDGLLSDAVNVLKGELGVSTADAPGAAPLELEVALLQQVEQDDEIVVRPIEQGDVLYYRGDLESSDKFKVFLRPSEDCFVYVLSLDSTGWLQVVYPESGRGQQVSANSEVFLPPSPDIDMSFAVDKFAGLETLYFVASRQRNAELERVLAPLVGLQRPDIDDPEAVESLGDAFVVRGVSDRSAGRGGRVQSRSGEQSFDTEALRKAAGGDLVLTRTFHHEIAQ